MENDDGQKTLQRSKRYKKSTKIIPVLYFPFLDGALAWAQPRAVWPTPWVLCTCKSISRRTPSRPPWRWLPTSVPSLTPFSTRSTGWTPTLSPGTGTSWVISHAKYFLCLFCTLHSARAKSKAAGIVEHIGYPPELLDTQKLDDLYSGLELNATHYLGNALNMTVFGTNYAFSKLREKVRTYAREERTRQSFSDDMSAFFNQ